MGSSQPPVLYDVLDGVAEITINRPHVHNGQTVESESELERAMIRADGDDRVRVVILTGAGEDFCVGADRAQLADTATEGSLAVELPLGLALFGAAVRKPVVAAINGRCAGGGMLWAASCDVRFASATAKFTTAWTKLGVGAEWGMAWHLPRIIGQGAALDLLLSSRLIGAEEALRLGFVSRVVPPDGLLDVARTWAHDVASTCSPTAMASAKRAVYDAGGSSLLHALADAAEATRQLAGGRDFTEGVAALAAGRLPEFLPLGGSPRDPRGLA